MTLTRRSLMAALTATAALPLGLFRALAAAVSGTVTGVVNTVKARKPDRPDDAQPVATGDAIEVGEAIETAKQSAVQITMADGSVVTVGARSAATVGGQGYEAMAFTKGNFRWNSGTAANVNKSLSTPALKIALKGTQIVVSIDDARTICCVIQGSITCTSKKTGVSAEVGEGQSILWATGSFGSGATNGVFTTGDVAVDQGIAAAAAAWAGAPPPPEPPPRPRPQPPKPKPGRN